MPKSSSINLNQKHIFDKEGLTVTYNKSYWSDCTESFILHKDGTSEHQNIKSVFEISEKDNLQQKLSEIGMFVKVFWID